MPHIDYLRWSGDVHNIYTALLCILTEISQRCLILHIRKKGKEVEEKDYHFSERAAGEFTRAIRLPEGTKADSIEATYADGVLKVTIPRSKAPEGKKTKVSVK